MRPPVRNVNGRVTARSETPLCEDSEAARSLEHRGCQVIGIRHAGLQLNVVVEARGLTRIQHVEQCRAQADRRPAVELLRPAEA